ncbi:glycoside hydrolase family protein [Acinetobacter sp. ANC 4640]
MADKKKPLAALGITGALLASIITYEGYTSKPVIPTKGDVPTIGNGTTVYPNGQRVKMTDKAITRQQAKAYLTDYVNKDAQKFATSIPNVKLSQAEYDVYLDWTYQYGIGAWNKSLIKASLVKGDYVQACKSLLKYKFVAGRDCSIRSNNCYGVYTRQVKRYDKCMGANS